MNEDERQFVFLVSALKRASMFSIAPGAKSFKSEKKIPNDYVCKHELRTESQKTIQLFHKQDQHPDTHKLLDVIFPAPFSDNLYFGTVYLSITPPCRLEALMSELERLDIRKNIPPIILSDITLNAQEESEHDATSSDESEEELGFETSEDEVESDEDISDDDSQCGADIFSNND